MNRIKLSKHQRFDPKVILVFTDGKLKSRDMKQLETMYSKLASEGIGLYITGKDQTEQKLLIGATKNKFHYELIKDANPAQWLTKKRLEVIDNDLTAILSTVRVTPQVIEQPATETDVEFKHRSEVEVKIIDLLDSTNRSIFPRKVLCSLSRVHRPQALPDKPY